MCIAPKSAWKMSIKTLEYSRANMWIWNVRQLYSLKLYRVSQEEGSVFWEVIVPVILSRNVYMNMCPIPNSFYQCLVLYDRWHVDWSRYFRRSHDRTKLPGLSENELPKQLEAVPSATGIAMYLQHDGVPSHYTRHVMQHLNGTFPNRWIGRGSTINWPPRSPDLTPLDFCLWGLMKSEVYRNKMDTRDELIVNTLDVIGCIKERQDALSRTTRHVFTRVAKCIDVDGGIFKYLV